MPVLGALVANGSASPAAGGGVSPPPAASPADYASLTRELGRGGVEVLDPAKDPGQGLNGAHWPGPWPPAADHTARRDERAPTGMSAPSTPGLREGERIAIGDAGHALELIMADGNGRGKFWIIDGHGQRVAAIWGEEQARSAVDQLIKTGKVAR
jgi:hypothetical protein